MHVLAGAAARTGGPAAAVFQLSRALREAGVESVIYTTDLDGSASDATAAPVALFELPPGAEHLDLRMFRARPPRRLAYSPGLGRTVRRDARAFDVMHIHSLWLYPQWVGYVAAQRVGVPFVVSLAGALNPWFRARARGRKAVAWVLWQRRCLSRAGAIHATTDEEAANAYHLAPNVMRCVVPNPVDVESFEPRYARAFARTRPDDSPLVLYVGRLSPVKGLDLLIRALDPVSRVFPSVRLVIAGPDDGRLVRELASLAAQLGVGARVTFTGMIDSVERARLLRQADLFVLPSRSENFAVAAVEAMAAGVPVVLSSAVNGAADHARAGAAVIAGLDADDLATRIVAVLGDASAREAMARAGVRRAQVFARPAVANAACAMYTSLLSRRATRPCQ